MAGVAEASVSDAEDANCGADCGGDSVVEWGASPDGVDGGGGDDVAEDMRR
jgi:hypothetical protein